MIKDDMMLVTNFGLNFVEHSIALSYSETGVVV